MDTEIDDTLGTLRQYLDFNTTRKRFVPGRILFKFPVAHSAPLKYNCSYHRNHIFFQSHRKPRRRAAKTHLTQNLF